MKDKQDVIFSLKKDNYASKEYRIFISVFSNHMNKSKRKIMSGYPCGLIQSLPHTNKFQDIFSNELFQVQMADQVKSFPPPKRFIEKGMFIKDRCIYMIQESLPGFSGPDTGTPLSDSFPSSQFIILWVFIIVGCTTLGWIILSNLDLYYFKIEEDLLYHMETNTKRCTGVIYDH